MKAKKLCFCLIIISLVTKRICANQLDKGITVLELCAYLNRTKNQGNAYYTEDGYACCLCSKGHYWESDCSGPDRPYDTKCPACQHDEQLKTYIDHDAHKLDHCQVDRCQHPLISVGGTTEKKSRCDCPEGFVKKFVTTSFSRCEKDDSKVVKSDIKKVPYNNMETPDKNFVTTAPESVTSNTEKVTTSPHKEVDDYAEGNKDSPKLEKTSDTLMPPTDADPDQMNPPDSPKLKTTTVTSMPPTHADADQMNPPDHSSHLNIVIGYFAGGIFFLLALFFFFRKNYSKIKKVILRKLRCSQEQRTSSANVRNSREEVVIMMPAESNSEQNDVIVEGSDAESATGSQSSVDQLSDIRIDVGEENNSAVRGKQETEPLLRTVEKGARKNMAIPLGNNINQEPREISNVSQDHAREPGRVNTQTTRLSTLHRTLRDKAIDKILSTIHQRDLTALGHWLIPTDNELDDIKERYGKDGSTEVARQVFRRGLQLNPNLSLYDFHSQVNNMQLGYLVDVFKECIELEREQERL